MENLKKKHAADKHIKNVNLLEWILESYEEFGVDLEIVGSRTTEGKQFYKGFQGIAGFLHYKIDNSEYFLED